MIKLDVESLDVMLNKSEPPIKEIIGSGILIEESKAVLYGVFKGGKTTLLQYIALCCAEGLPLFGDSKRFPTLPSIVFYVQMEIPRKAFKKRLGASSLSNSTVVRTNFHTTTVFWLKIDKEDGVAVLEEEVKRLQPDVVIIDPFYKVISGSENSTEDIERVTDQLDLLIEQHHFALIVSAQARKNLIVPKSGAPIDLGDQELRGSTGIPAWVDTIIGLRRNAGNRRNLNFTLRHGDEESLNVTVAFDKKTGLYSVV